jgi:hypothetical protein
MSQSRNGKRRSEVAMYRWWMIMIAIVVGITMGVAAVVSLVMYLSSSPVATTVEGLTQIKQHNKYKTPDENKVHCFVSNRTKQSVTGTCTQPTQYGQTTVVDTVDIDKCNYSVKFTPTIKNGVLLDHSGRMPDGFTRQPNVVKPVIVCGK